MIFNLYIATAMCVVLVVDLNHYYNLVCKTVVLDLGEARLSSAGSNTRGCIYEQRTKLKPDSHQSRFATQRISPALSLHAQLVNLRRKS